MLKNAIERNETEQWQTTGSLSYSGALIFGSSDCPTCPKGQKFDVYRNNKSLFTYAGKGNNGQDIVANGDAEGVVVTNGSARGQSGVGDVKNYDGYTMSSNSSKFGVVADGNYVVNRIGKGEKKGPYGFEWTLNKRGEVAEQDNYNPANPQRNPAYLDGVLIHRPNNDGRAGIFQKDGKTHGVLDGCLLIAPKQWTIFKNQLKTVNSFIFQINR